MRRAAIMVPPEDGVELLTMAPKIRPLYHPPIDKLGRARRENHKGERRSGAKDQYFGVDGILTEGDDHLPTGREGSEGNNSMVSDVSDIRPACNGGVTTVMALAR